MSTDTAAGDVLNTTDRALLREMSDGERHDAPELAALTQRNRSYINTRLRHLTQHGFAHAIQHSRGMYEITTKGMEVCVDE